MIAVRGSTKRLLEGSGEVIGTQARELGELRKRYLFGKMLLDMLSDYSFLPCGKSTADRWLKAGRRKVEALQLVCDHKPQRLQVVLVARGWCFDDRSQPE